MGIEAAIKAKFLEITHVVFLSSLSVSKDVMVNGIQQRLLSKNHGPHPQCLTFHQKVDC